jgi:hypothetical protein
VVALPTRRTIAELQRQLGEAEQQRGVFFERGAKLVSAFRRQYPNAPATLVRYADRTLNDYRWRLSGSARWRYLGLPTNKATIDLTGETGVRILNSLPEAARSDWLSFEARRQQLNHDSALVKYRVLRLRQLIQHQEALRQLVRRNVAE